MSNKGSRFLELETDLLAIGGGGAGVMAAITAARKGLKATLVLKGALGRSGNTIMVGGTFAMDGESAIGYGYDGDPAFTRDVWFEEIIKQGFYLSDQKMVDAFVNRAAPLVKQVVDWGEQAGQYFHFFKPAGFFMSGRGMGQALRHGVMAHREIQVMEDVYITDLLTCDGRCTGAMGFNVYTGDPVVIKARSVVLGTGGFQPFSLKITVSDMTGDGLGMALRAGVPVADMEFPLYVPGVCLSPSIHKGSIFPFLYNILTTAYPEMPEPMMVNQLGEDISGKIPPDLLEMAKGSEWMKLIYTYWWGREIVGGRGSENGGIYFSFDHVSKDEFLKGTDTIINLMTIWYKDLWKYQGDDFTDLRDDALAGKPWEVGLGHEYTNGGIMVNKHAESALPGLYAAGECCSGCFGAHRVHDALVEMLVQGEIAGENAGNAFPKTGVPEIDPKQVARHFKRIYSPFERKNGVSPTVVRQHLEKAADKGFNFVRNEVSLQEALSEVVRIRTELLPEMSLTSKSRAYNQEWIESIEVENLALCLEAGLRAAIERKESRGTHIRSDYPVVDHDRFLKRFCFRLEEERLTLFSEPPSITRLQPPEGKVDNIMTYALSCEPKFKNAGAYESPTASTTD